MQTPSSSQLSPVFHAFGLCTYTAQLLESALKLLLAVIDEERRRTGLPTRPSTGNPRSYRTIGILFGEVKLVEYLSEHQQTFIKHAIETRNIVVHSYWDRKHALAMQTAAGRRWLISDINEKRVLLRDADRLISKFIDSYLAKYGHSIASLSETFGEDSEVNNQPPDEVLH